MLSAFAARKAQAHAQALVQPSSLAAGTASPSQASAKSPPTTSSGAEDDNDDEDDVLDRMLSASKRKETDDGRSPSRQALKKRKAKQGAKTKAKGKAKAPVKRYFDGDQEPKSVVLLLSEDGPQHQSDDEMVLADSSDSSDDEDAQHSPLEGEEEEEEGDEGNRPRFLPASRVALDAPFSTSYGDFEEQEAEAATTPPRPPCLSSFRPKKSQNYWPLTSTQLKALIHELHPFFPPSKVSPRRTTTTTTTTAPHLSPAALVRLKSGETLALAGTYALTVIEGALELCGVTLYAPSHPLAPNPVYESHKIYAPLSSPIPILECAPSSAAQLAPSLEDVMRGVTGSGDGADRDESGAVVLVQEWQSGVEGLGRVVASFASAFTLPRPVEEGEQEEEEDRERREGGEWDFGLGGMIIVSPFFFGARSDPF